MIFCNQFFYQKGVFVIYFFVLMFLFNSVLFSQNVVPFLERTSINNKSEFELSDVFQDYTGLVVTPEDMSDLEESAAKLDALNYRVNFICSYSVLNHNTTNQLLLNALDDLDGESYFAVSVGATTGLNSEVLFSILINDDVTEDIESISRFLEVYSKQKYIELGSDLKRIPDVISLTIEKYFTYLDIWQSYLSSFRKLICCSRYFRILGILYREFIL